MAASILRSTNCCCQSQMECVSAPSLVQEEQPGSGSAHVPQLWRVGARAASRSTALMRLRLQAYALQRCFLWCAKRERPLNPL